MKPGLGETIADPHAIIARNTNIVRLAKLWQQRLGIGHWPTAYLVRKAHRPLIALSYNDQPDEITLPNDSQEPDIVFALLLYSQHNVSADAKPSVADTRRAARQLVNTWTEQETTA